MVHKEPLERQATPAPRDYSGLLAGTEKMVSLGNPDLLVLLALRVPKGRRETLVHKDYSDHRVGMAKTESQASLVHRVC